MGLPAFPGFPRAFSASRLLEATGQRIQELKAAHELSWRDVGAAFGVGDDAAAAYAAGAADMKLTTYVRGVVAFDSAFGDVPVSFARRRLCVTGVATLPDRAGPRVCTALLMKLVKAIEDGSDVSEDELRDAAVEIAEAGRLLDALRDRLAVLGIGGDA